MAKQRKIHPNSIKALKDAAAARVVTKTRVNITLTEKALTQLDKAAIAQGISRSELIERYGRNYHLIEAVLDAVEDVLYDGTSTEECLPPHPSYEVDGDVFRKLSSAFMRLMEAEGKG